MAAIICLLIPPYVIIIAREWILRRHAKLITLALDYVITALLLNSAMVAILYIMSHSCKGLIAKLNSRHIFALKYFAIALVISIAVIWIGWMAHHKPRFMKIAKTVWPYALLVGVFLFLCVFMNRNINSMLDSDMSSELVLAKLLSEEHGILSKNWFYSTELRVLNTQLVFAPLFLLCSHWHTVRVVGSIILWLLLLCSYYYLCCQLGKRKYFAISAVCFLLPFSSTYYSIVITGVYYIPHIIISFLTLGLIFHCAKCRRKGSRFTLTALLCALSVLAGMGGPRQLIILYIPLFLATALLYAYERYKQPGETHPHMLFLLKESTLSAVFAVVGYLINGKILSSIYTFTNWASEEIDYKGISLDSFIEVINGLLTNFGYRTEALFSFVSVTNLCALILLLLTCTLAFHGIRNQSSSIQYRLVAAYLFAGIAVLLILYTITTMTYSDNYETPVLAFSIPLIILGMSEVPWHQNHRAIVCKVLVIAVILCCGSNFLRYMDGIEYSEPNYTDEYQQIAYILKNDGYSEGYATFWNGNILTEFSDGSIDVRVWKDGGIEDIDQLYEWLQPKSHIDTVPEGPVFVLVERAQLEYSALFSSLDDENIFYESDTFIIYGYESYDALKADAADG